MRELLKIVGFAVVLALGILLAQSCGQPNPLTIEQGEWRGEGR